MSRFTAAKGRIVRRFGINIFGSEKYDKLLAKRNFPPGVHGKRRFSKPSEFGKQLLEKQKVRYVFGITERQCRNYYSAAIRQKGDTGKAFMQALERRLDNVIYRAGLAQTRMQARQMVSHGLLLLNGRGVKSPALAIKAGDAITIRERNKNSALFRELEKKKMPAPAWLSVDKAEKKIEVLRLPDTEDFEKLVAPELIVEFYSK